MLSNNLRLFIRVAEKGSVTEVANELYISQPAVSKAIKNLEIELGVTLFYRDKRSGIRLTNIGETVLYHARLMEDAENRIYQAAYQEKNFLGGRLRIGAAPVTTSTILSEVLAQYKAKYPNVKVEILEAGARDVRKMVTDYQVDFGITFSPFGDLECKILLQDKMVAICVDPLPLNSCFTLEKGTENLIFCTRSKEATIENLKNDLPLNFGESLTLLNAESVISMVEHGNGVGILSKLVAESIPNHLYVYPIEPTIEIDVGVVARSFDRLTPVAQEFVKMIQDVTYKI